MARGGQSTRSIPARIARTKAASGTPHRRELLWRAIRILRRFTTHELMAVAEQDNKRSVLQYLRQLRRAGFLRAQYGNAGRHEATSFVLIRNSGPKTPAVLQQGAVVYDPNTEQEYRLNGTE